MKSFKFYLIFNFCTFSIVLSLDQFKEKILVNPNGNVVCNISIGVANFSQLPDINLKAKLDDVVKKTSNHLQSIKKIFNDNKMTFFVSGFSGIYLFILYKIFSINTFLNRTNCWHAWKSDLPFEKFLSISHVQLAQELVTEINKHYIEKDIVDSNAHLNFTNEINFELIKLQAYIKFIRWLKSLYLSKIFRINDDSINLIQEKINRLKYLKNVFLNNVISKSLIQNNDSTQ